MHDGARYPVPAARHRVEQTIDRSRFICTLARVDSADAAHAFVREVSAELAGATHHCWAFVAGPPACTNRVGMSDDGEPHGTAGRPMLTVLLHSGVGEVAAVVTRHYGGVKLGTGGLARAYGGTVQLALETLARAERVDYAWLTVGFGYASIAAVQQILAASGAEIDATAYDADVRYDVRVPRGRLDGLRAALADATRGEARAEERMAPPAA